MPAIQLTHNTKVKIDGKVHTVTGNPSQEQILLLDTSSNDITSLSHTALMSKIDAGSTQIIHIKVDEEKRRKRLEKRLKEQLATLPDTERQEFERRRAYVKAIYSFKTSWQRGLNGISLPCCGVQLLCQSLLDSGLYRMQPMDCHNTVRSVRTSKLFGSITSTDHPALLLADRRNFPIASVRRALAPTLHDKFEQTKDMSILPQGGQFSTSNMGPLYHRMLPAAQYCFHRSLSVMPRTGVLAPCHNTKMPGLCF